MGRAMKGIMVLFLLVIGLIVSIQGTISAKATKTEMIGELDLSTPIIIDPGVVFVDKGGNTHTQEQVVEGKTTLKIGDDTIKVRTYIEINGVNDGTGTGPIHGWFIHFIGKELTDETMLWKGRYEGMDVNLIFSAKYQAQGYNDFAGMKMLGIGQEKEPSPGNPDPNILYVEGHILDPHGASLSPGKRNIATTAWGEIKVK